MTLHIEQPGSLLTMCIKTIIYIYQNGELFLVKGNNLKVGVMAEFLKYLLEQKKMAIKKMINILQS